MLLARGTLVELPARLRVDIAGDPQPRSHGLALDAPVTGSVVNDEDVTAAEEGVNLPRGAYVRLATSVTVVRADFSRGTLAMGLTVFVPAGSVIGLIAGLPDRGGNKGGGNTGLVVGGLVVLALVLAFVLGSD